MMKHGREGHRKGPREMCTGGEWIYGRNPVVETLRAGRRTATEIILPPYDKGESDEIAQLRATAPRRKHENSLCRLTAKSAFR